VRSCFERCGWDILGCSPDILIDISDATPQINKEHMDQWRLMINVIPEMNQKAINTKVCFKKSNAFYGTIIVFQ